MDGVELTVRNQMSFMIGRKGNTQAILVSSSPVLDFRPVSWRMMSHVEDRVAKPVLSCL